MRPLTAPSGIFASRTSGASSARLGLPGTMTDNPSRSGNMIACHHVTFHVLPGHKACRHSPRGLLHESIDIGGSLGAIVHVIGVLVHVEDQDRLAARDGRGVIGRPL